MSDNKVVPFTTHSTEQCSKPRRDPWRALTWNIILDQHRRGVLNPRVLEYLMAGVGIEPAPASGDAP